MKKLEDLVAAGKLDGEQSSSEKGSRNVLNSLGPSDAAGNETLRTFFIQLTEKMLAPLNRYVSSLIPPVGYVWSCSFDRGHHGAYHSPDVDSSPEGIKPFALTAFLHHLKAMAPNPLQFRSKGLTTKGKVETEFYTAFCKSPGFAGWLRNRLVSLTEAKWGPGQASRIPLPVINQSGGHGAPSPTASPLRREDLMHNRVSNDSSHRSSISSVGWSEIASGRRGSDGGVLSMTAHRRPL